MSQAPPNQTSVPDRSTGHTERVGGIQLQVGTPVIVQRDESRYGVGFGKSRRVAAWFLAHELVAR